ncbi:MAG: ABC transporter substrate-binding protein [Bacteroidota bacterium]
MDTIKLALDWTPNINHIGFFVAKNRGYYEKQGLRVEITDPSDNDYQLTPAKKVELGQADLALCPMESVISYRTKSQPFDMQAIAAILQDDLSAIAVLESSPVQCPSDLDGKVYASYGARYEDAIVKQMVKNAGGAGELQLTYPAKLGIWNTLVEKASDATWIFLNWEGVEAKFHGLKLRHFRMHDFEIPYSYSPVLVGSASRLANKADVIERFLIATREGYLYCDKVPVVASAILRAALPTADQKIDVDATLEATAEAFGTQETWGQMDPEKVEQFLAWLKEHNLEQEELKVSDLINNDYLQTTLI